MPKWPIFRFESKNVPFWHFIYFTSHDGSGRNGPFEMEKINGHVDIDMHIQTFDLSRAIPDTVIMANHPYVPEQLGPNYGP